MNNSGVKTDILTGRPVEDEIRKKDMKAETEAKERLKAEASWQGVAESDAGRKLLDLIRDKLDKRVEELVKADPESSAYVKILKEMGLKEATARAAAKALFDKELNMRRQ